MKYNIKEIYDTTDYEVKFQLKKLGAKVISTKKLNDEQIKQLLDVAKYSSTTTVPVLEQIIRRLYQARQNKEQVLICGDYDADGICATTIMVHALKKFGIDCGFYIPNRFKEGYGLSKSTVDQAYQKGYRLFITVDNGVKAFEACEYAQSLGLDLILTDHHRYDVLPPHTMFFHPESFPDPFKCMCGAAVALLISNALIGEHPDSSIWAMIATIGDIMPLTNENRIIVRKGLAYLKKGFALPIQKLAAPFVRWDESAVAFQIVPKLNAIGRMADQANANMAVHYLLSHNHEEIERVSKQIISLNEFRKIKSEEMYYKCKELIDPNALFQVLYDDSFHEGLLGIAAGRIASEMHQPTMVLTSKNQLISGSVRSVGNIDLMKIFEGRKKHFNSFGGHPKACALSFNKEELDEFKSYCNSLIEPSFLDEVEVEDVIAIELNEITLDEAIDLTRLSPFGEGWKKPLFLIKMPCCAMTRLKGGHLKFTNDQLELIYFRAPMVDEVFFYHKDHALIVTIEVKKFRGKQSVQLQIQDVISLQNHCSVIQ